MIPAYLKNKTAILAKVYRLGLKCYDVAYLTSLQPYYPQGGGDRCVLENHIHTSMPGNTN